MPTAAESIAAWLLAGNPTATLVIRDAGVVVLPPLPAALRHLSCIGCLALIHFPPLPVTLITLFCDGSTALIQLPQLPAALTHLDCYGCAALIQLPPLPAALEHCCVLRCASLRELLPLPVLLTSLWCGVSVRLPDACPNTQMRLNLSSVEGSRLAWRARVGAQHAADRRRVAASLPPLALLFV